MAEEGFSFKRYGGSRLEGILRRQNQWPARRGFPAMDDSAIRDLETFCTVMDAGGPFTVLWVPSSPLRRGIRRWIPLERPPSFGCRRHHHRGSDEVMYSEICRLHAYCLTSAIETITSKQNGIRRGDAREQGPTGGPPQLGSLPAWRYRES